MRYRLIDNGSSWTIEGQDAVYAKINEDLQLIFCGDLPKEMCDEIIDFLRNNSIHIIDGYAYELTN